MRMSKTALMIPIVLMAIDLASNLAAQEKDKVLSEDFFSMGSELGVGARAIGMGGAYSGVADDYTAMYWNPAGLGQMRRREFNLGFSQNSVKSEADFLDALTESSDSFTRLNSIGLVFPVPTSQGSLVFGFGYDKARDYGGLIDVGTLRTSDSLYLTHSILDDGSRSQFTLSGAIEAGPNFFIGASINFIDGNFDHSSEYREDDTYDLYYISVSDSDDTFLKDWGYSSWTKSLQSNLDGTNLKLGFLYRSESVWRLGATITLPTTYTIKENWQWGEYEYYDEQHNPWSDGEKGVYEYQYSEPYSASIGFSAKLLDMLLLSAEAEFKDWTQAKFEDDPPVSDMDQAKTNRAIKKEMEAATKLRVGAEFGVPGSNLRLRGGLFSDPSPYKDKNIRPDRTYYSGGLSIMMDKQAMFDLTYVRGSWEETKYPYDEDELYYPVDAYPIALDRSFQKFVATLSLRF